MTNKEIQIQIALGILRINELDYFDIKKINDIQLLRRLQIYAKKNRCNYLIHDTIIDEINRIEYER